MNDELLIEMSEEARKLVGRFVRDLDYSKRFPNGIHAVGIVTAVQSVDEKEGARVFVRGLNCEGGIGHPCGGASRLVSELEVLRDSEAFVWVSKNRANGYPMTRDALDAETPTVHPRDLKGMLDALNALLELNGKGDSILPVVTRKWYEQISNRYSHYFAEAEKRRADGKHCPVCGKEIPPEEMRSAYNFSAHGSFYEHATVCKNCQDLVEASKFIPKLADEMAKR